MNSQLEGSARARKLLSPGQAKEEEGRPGPRTAIPKIQNTNPTGPAFKGKNKLLGRQLEPTISGAYTSSFSCSVNNVPGIEGFDRITPSSEASTVPPPPAIDFVVRTRRDARSSQAILLSDNFRYRQKVAMIIVVRVCPTVPLRDFQGGRLKTPAQP